MKLLSDSRRYGVVAAALHWVIAGAVIFMLWFGRYMTDLPKGSFERLQAIQLHRAIGITILLLTLVRIGWRLHNRGPNPMPSLKGWELWLMKTVHYWFYILLLAIPLTGWISTSTGELRVPISFFGWFHWPFFPGSASNHAANEVFTEGHEFLGNVMIGLIALHILGALRHTFVLRDRLLKRMLPWAKL
jgi:cytochrome b561